MSCPIEWLCLNYVGNSYVVSADVSECLSSYLGYFSPLLPYGLQALIAAHRLVLPMVLRVHFIGENGVIWRPGHLAAPMFTRSDSPERLFLNMTPSLILRHTWGKNEGKPVPISFVLN